MSTQHKVLLAVAVVVLALLVTLPFVRNEQEQPDTPTTSGNEEPALPQPTFVEPWNEYGFKLVRPTFDKAINTNGSLPIRGSMSRLPQVKPAAQHLRAEIEN